MKIFLYLLTFMNFAAFAVNEAHLPSIYFSDVVPVLTEKSRSGYFVGKMNKRIHYYHYAVSSPRGVIVVSPGQSEPALKYAEFVYDFKDRGFDIFVIDHRGQGISDRMLPDPVKSHVENFVNYVDDLESLIVNIVKPSRYQRSLFFANSMGGAIAAGVLERHPRIFDRVIMSVPMFKIHTKQYSESTALRVTQFLNRVGLSGIYAPEQGPYKPDAGIEVSNLSSSQVRFELNRELLKRYTRLAVGGTTSGWVQTSVLWTRRIRAVTDLFQVPTTFFQATQDTWVKPEGQRQVCDGNADYCSVIVVQGSRHDIVSERDVYRDRLLNYISDYLSASDPR